MDFRIVLHRELGEGVAVGILDEQEFAALATALNDSLRLIRVKKYGVLVAPIKILALIDAVCLILAAVIGDTAAGMLVPCRDLLRRD